MAVTLSQYLTRTKQLLQNPASAASKLFTDAFLTDSINHARSQIAGEGCCIRNYATLAAPAGVRKLDFTDIALGAPSDGVGGIFTIRQALVNLGDGSIWLQPRSFQWFTLYSLNQVVPMPALPEEWSQFGQGVTGNIFLDPVPDQDYILSLDCVCYPVDLEDDTTDEVIPYPWTDCVPFFAAYYALLGAQRQTDADEAFKRYQTYMQRARAMSNPDVVPMAYAQPARDPTMANRIGAVPQGGGQ